MGSGSGPEQKGAQVLEVKLDGCGFYVLQKVRCGLDRRQGRRGDARAVLVHLLEKRREDEVQVCGEGKIGGGVRRAILCDIY